MITRKYVIHIVTFYTPELWFKKIKEHNKNNFEEVLEDLNILEKEFLQWLDRNANR